MILDFGFIKMGTLIALLLLVPLHLTGATNFKFKRNNINIYKPVLENQPALDFKPVPPYRKATIGQSFPGGRLDRIWHRKKPYQIWGQNNLRRPLNARISPIKRINDSFSFNRALRDRLNFKNNLINYYNPKNTNQIAHLRSRNILLKSTLKNMRPTMKIPVNNDKNNAYVVKRRHRDHRQKGQLFGFNDGYFIKGRHREKNHHSHNRIKVKRPWIHKRKPIGINTEHKFGHRYVNPKAKRSERLSKPGSIYLEQQFANDKSEEGKYYKDRRDVNIEENIGSNQAPYNFDEEDIRKKRSLLRTGICDLLLRKINCCILEALFSQQNQINDFVGRPHIPPYQTNFQGSNYMYPKENSGATTVGCKSRTDDNNGYAAGFNTDLHDRYRYENPEDKYENDPGYSSLENEREDNFVDQLTHLGAFDFQTKYNENPSTTTNFFMNEEVQEPQKDKISGNTRFICIKETDLKASTVNNKHVFSEMDFEEGSDYDYDNGNNYQDAAGKPILANANLNPYFSFNNYDKSGKDNPDFIGDLLPPDENKNNLGNEIGPFGDNNYYESKNRNYGQSSTDDDFISEPSNRDELQEEADSHPRESHRKHPKKHKKTKSSHKKPSKGSKKKDFNEHRYTRYDGNEDFDQENEGVHSSLDNLFAENNSVDLDEFPGPEFMESSRQNDATRKPIRPWSKVDKIASTLHGPAIASSYMDDFIQHSTNRPNKHIVNQAWGDDNTNPYRYNMDPSEVSLDDGSVGSSPLDNGENESSCDDDTNPYRNNKDSSEVSLYPGRVGSSPLGNGRNVPIPEDLDNSHGNQHDYQSGPTYGHFLRGRQKHRKTRLDRSSAHRGESHGINTENINVQYETMIRRNGESEVLNGDDTNPYTYNKDPSEVSLDSGRVGSSPLDKGGNEAPRKDDYPNRNNNGLTEVSLDSDRVGSGPLENGENESSSDDDTIPNRNNKDPSEVSLDRGRVGSSPLENGGNVPIPEDLDNSHGNHHDYQSGPTYGHFLRGRQKHRKIRLDRSSAPRGESHDINTENINVQHETMTRRNGENDVLNGDDTNPYTYNKDPSEVSLDSDRVGSSPLENGGNMPIPEDIDNSQQNLNKRNADIETNNESMIPQTNSTGNYSSYHQFTINQDNTQNDQIIVDSTNSYLQSINNVTSNETPLSGTTSMDNHNSNFSLFSNGDTESNITTDGDIGRISRGVTQSASIVNNANNGDAALVTDIIGDKGGYIETTKDLNNEDTLLITNDSDSGYYVIMKNKSKEYIPLDEENISSQATIKRSYASKISPVKRSADSHRHVSPEITKKNNQSVDYVGAIVSDSQTTGEMKETIGTTFKFSTARSTDIQTNITNGTIYEHSYPKRTNERSDKENGELSLEDYDTEVDNLSMAEIYKDQNNTERDEFNEILNLSRESLLNDLNITENIEDAGDGSDIDRNFTFYSEVPILEENRLVRESSFSNEGEQNNFETLANELDSRQNLDQRNSPYLPEIESVRNSTNQTGIGSKSLTGSSLPKMNKNKRSHRKNTTKEISTKKVYQKAVTWILLDHMLLDQNSTHNNESMTNGTESMTNGTASNVIDSSDRNNGDNKKYQSHYNAIVRNITENIDSASNTSNRMGELRLEVEKSISRDKDVRIGSANISEPDDSDLSSDNISEANLKRTYRETRQSKTHNTNCTDGGKDCSRTNLEPSFSAHNRKRKEREQFIPKQRKRRQLQKENCVGGKCFTSHLDMSFHAYRDTIYCGGWKEFNDIYGEGSLELGSGKRWKHSKRDGRFVFDVTVIKTNKSHQIFTKGCEYACAGRPGKMVIKGEKKTLWTNNKYNSKVLSFISGDAVDVWEPFRMEVISPGSDCKKRSTPFNILLDGSDHGLSVMKLVFLDPNKNGSSVNFAREPRGGNQESESVGKKSQATAKETGSLSAVLKSIIKRTKKSKSANRLNKRNLYTDASARRCPRSQFPSDTVNNDHSWPHSNDPDFKEQTIFVSRSLGVNAKIESFKMFGKIKCGLGGACKRGGTTEILECTLLDITLQKKN